MGIKLTGGLPKEELNGLVAIHGSAVRDPKAKHLAIVVLDTAEVTQYPDNSAKFKIARIEAIGDDHVEIIAELLEKTTEARTGKTRLDIGIPDELDLRDVIKRQKESAKKTPSRTRKKPDVHLPEPAELEATPSKPEDVVDAEIVDDETPDAENVADPAESETPDAPDATQDPDSGLTDDEKWDAADPSKKPE